MIQGLPQRLSGTESTCKAGTAGLILGPERCPGRGNGNSLQYPWLENSMDKGAWQATACVCVGGRVSWRVRHDWAQQCTMIKRHLGGRGRDAELVRMPKYKFWLVSFIVSESLFILFVWLGFFFWPHLTAHGILGQIRAPCIGTCIPLALDSQSLNHWATREVPQLLFISNMWNRNNNVNIYSIGLLGGKKCLIFGYIFSTVPFIQGMCILLTLDHNSQN